MPIIQISTANDSYSVGKIKFPDASASKRRPTITNIYEY